MDSLSQSKSNASTPPNEAVAPPTEPAPAPAARVSTFDLAARIALFGVLMFALARQVGPVDVNGLIYPLMIYGFLAAGYLLASVGSVATEIRRQAEQQPLALALAPLILLLPLMAYARATEDFDLTEILFTGVLVLLPTACAILNVAPLRRSDISLGLITVILPILLPFARETVSDGAMQPLTTLDVVLRIGAAALPALWLLLTTPEQKTRLNFLFVCAVLSVWYAVEFAAFPVVTIEPALEVTYFQLAVIPLFLYVLAVAGRFDRLGLSFQPTPRGLSVITANFGLFAALAIPLGLVTGFLTPNFAGPTLLEGAAQALLIFLLIALPAELLFRGALLTQLEETLRLPIGILIAITALIFGAAHLNNPPNAVWYAVLAGLAGVFYARTFLATRNVAAAAVVHTAVNWVWWLLFSG
jgi:membrane protease YdiL (CAAX protease family)